MIFSLEKRRRKRSSQHPEEMEKVPDCILVEVLSYFSKKELMKLCLVSKRWHDLCFDSFLWNDISTDEFCSVHVEDNTLYKLLKHSKSIKKLSLKGCYQVTNDILNFVSLQSSRLEELDLENCFKLNDQGIVTLSKHCRNLKVVNVMNTVITDFGLCHLLNQNTKLKEIIGSPIAITESTVECITKNCKDLEFLHVEQNEYTPSIVDVHLKNNQIVLLTSDMVECIAQNCSKLKVLIMKYPYSCVSDWALAQLGYHCQNLECIEVGNNVIRISDAGVVNLCSNLKNLLKFDINESCISDISLYTIARKCPSLEQLSIGQTGHITDIGVLNIMQGCISLESFSLCCGAEGYVTDLGVFAITQAPCSFNLIRLSLKYWHISDFGLLLLSQNLPNLMYLSLEGCAYLSNSGLKDALKFLLNLENLDVSRTSCVKSDGQLQELSFLLPSSLKSLMLATGSEISEKGCHQFQDNLPDCEIIFWS